VVTVPDPDEHDRRNDAARRDGSADPGATGSDQAGAAGAPSASSGSASADAAATDAAFASIIAEWRADPDVPRWPSDDAPADRGAQPPPAPSGSRKPDVADDDHFEPPEPPPLPMPRPRTVGGVFLLALGIVLLIRPSLLTLGESLGTPLGLLAITSGIGWLVLGLRPGGPPPEGWDDGARL
jgi:hypothetical protein